MTRDEAREYIHEHSQEYATEAWGRDKSGKGWICPLCGSGTGDKGTGITTKDGVHFTCWAGCFQSADVIDVIGFVEHIPEADHVAKFEAARREFRIDVDEPERPRGIMNTTTEARDKVAKAESEPITEDPKMIFDSSPSFSGNHEYLTKKGVKPHGDIRLYDGRALLLGCYDVEGNFRGAQRIYPGMKEKPYLKGSRKPGAFFTLHDGGPDSSFLIGEGYATMASVLEHLDGESYTVIAAMDSGNLDDVAAAIRGKYPARPVLILGDDDSAKNSAGNKAARACIEKGVADVALFPPFTDEDRAKGLTDWNDYAQVYGDKQTAAALVAKIAPVIKRAKMTPEERQVEARQEYLSKISASADIQAFVDRIKTGEQIPPFPTGFYTLDKVLNGGLRPGLYVLGAIQSLGKTAFCMQMMDNIAAAGHDVLVFSLEMSRQELIARSVSRITYELSRKAVSPGQMAYSTVELLSGSCYDKDGAEGKRRIVEAVTAYSQYSDNIYLVEGVGDVTVGQMLEATQRHIQLTGRRPVVLCDYLQIVPAEETKGRTDKQNVDFNVVALKRLSRDLSIPVVVISSFNRQNYAEPLNASAFKESGAVEYSADVLIGLQYRGMEYRVGDEKEGQRGRRVAALINRMNRRGEEGKPQGIHVKVMKNRTGYKKGVYLSYLPAFNYFECDTDADEQERRADEEWARGVEKEARAGKGGMLH